MDLFDFMDLLTFLDDIRFSRRYGWGSFLWFLACLACCVVAHLLFESDFAIFGVVGVIGAVACFVLSCRQSWIDTRKKDEEEARTREQQKND